MNARGPAGVLRALPRGLTIRLALLALAIGGICFYFGTDLWHAIALGGVGAVLIAAWRAAARLEVSATPWLGEERSVQHGSRREVAELSWGLRGSYGRVSRTALWRVQRLARRRLAAYQLDPLDPADRPRIEQLIGRRAYSIVVQEGGRPPRLPTLLRCLDAIDALGTREGHAR